MQFSAATLVAILAVLPAIMAFPSTYSPKLNHKLARALEARDLQKRSCDCAAYLACEPGCAAFANDPYGSDLGEGLCIESCWTSSGCTSSSPAC